MRSQHQPRLRTPRVQDYIGCERRKIEWEPEDTKIPDI